MIHPVGVVSTQYREYSYDTPLQVYSVLNIENILMIHPVGVLSTQYREYSYDTPCRCTQYSI